MKKYSISDFSHIFGLNESTLRYYEKENLIKPHRYDNHHRYYTDDDVVWLKFLLHLKGTGMSIDNIKHYIIWRKMDDQTIPQRINLLNHTKTNFLKRMNKYKHHLQILNDKLNWYYSKENGSNNHQENFANYLKRLGHKE